MTTLEASKLSRRGCNLGIQLTMLPLFGLALAPIAVTQLLLFTHRNVWICAMLIPCWLTSQIALTTLLPSYLTTHLHLSIARMGFILSATGFGGAAGNLLLPALSDHVGGEIADRFGIVHTFDLPIVMLVIGLVIGCFLVETAPRRIGPAGRRTVEARTVADAISVAPSPVPRRG